MPWAGVATEDAGMRPMHLAAEIALAIAVGTGAFFVWRSSSLEATRVHPPTSASLLLKWGGLISRVQGAIVAGEASDPRMADAVRISRSAYSDAKVLETLERKQKPTAWLRERIGIYEVEWEVLVGDLFN